MKISAEKNNKDIEILNIVNAKYKGKYSIAVKFNNGLSIVVDFKKFLSKSIHPEIRKYLVKENFKKFEIIDGNLNWNDYDLIFPLEDLYKKKI